MALRQSEAFVLKGYELGEKDRIIVFFTRDYGKTRCVARGARGKSTRYGAGLEPMTRVEMTFYEKAGRELFTLGDCEVKFSPFKISGDVVRSVSLSYMAELLDGFVQPNQEDDALFRLVGKMVSAVTAGSDIPASLVYFELWLLKLEGIMPEPEHCSLCGGSTGGEPRFVLEKTGFLCKNCSLDFKGYLDVGKDLQRIIRAVVRSSPERFLSRPPKRSGLVKLRKITVPMISANLGKRLKSLPILEQVLAGVK